MRKMYLGFMTASQYCVIVVVDREYGERLPELTISGPVWIVDSPANRSAAQKIWSELPNQNHLDGVTVFKSSEDRSAEDSLLDQLDTIDLHHGTYSADPPYTVLESVGVPESERIRKELARFGFNEIHAKSTGFRAVRPLP